MPRTHLSSNTLLLWLSLSAAAAVCALVNVGCSSSDDSGTSAAAGKGGSSHAGGSTGKAGSSPITDAGETSTGGVPDEPDGMGEGGRPETPSGGTGGTASVAGSGSVTGGSSNTGGTGETGETGEGGSGGVPDTTDPEVTAAQARALALINGLSSTRKCTSCHDVTYQGSGFYPNITPDVTTGIGSWDADDIKAAIRDGKDKDGKTLCATMERYAFSDAQLADLVIYLQHLTPVSKKITGKCPSL